MKWIRAFSEGGREQAALLGGKGANLAEMTRLGLPVPPGFIVTTEACRAYMADGRLPPDLLDEVRRSIAALERTAGRRFGDPADPLLLSVRSGAPFSMPGMMDTILDLGLGPDAVAGLAARTGDERFALDARRRFLQMFGRIALGVAGDSFEAALTAAVAAAGVTNEQGLGPDELGRLVAEFESIIAREGARSLPSDPFEQLEVAIIAVFESWNGRRARDYRRLEGIPDDLGTAVSVQMMVFGNAGPDSGTGVAFTRDPATGENRPYGDFLVDAQGEDVVAGVRATEPLDTMATRFPECHSGLLGAIRLLESHYRDMCDIEFTIENGRLFILQTRVGKRTATAALRMAVEMEQAGMIDRREAVLRVSPDSLGQVLHPQFDPSAAVEVLTTGLGVSPGAAVGAVCFDPDAAQQRHAAGERVVLVRIETSPDDLHGIIAAEGVLTVRGGLVSHAAVVARGMGKPAVCGAAAIEVDLHAGVFRVNGVEVSEGEVISIDGTDGRVVLGAVPVVRSTPTGPFEELLTWADEFRELGVRANADLPHDAELARSFGAEGIGLCRTEHMFLGDRLPIVQRYILAVDRESERAALDELAALQLEDFVGLLTAMDGLPVTVRLIDPPLHEFLPDIADLLVRDALGRLDEDGRRLLEAATEWHEDNPMLGTRGVRLGVLRPDLYRMQVRALFEAAVRRRRSGGDPRVEVMIPLVVTERELDIVGAWVRTEADAVLGAAGIELDYMVGTMVETPRAAIVADALARSAQFFSFGTNDLTQTTFGFSRDDVEGRIIPTYLREGILADDPFRTLDVIGVGSLVRDAVERGRSTRPDLEVGICGEHGGDPRSIRFCHEIGLDYVSCSPFRVPIARLAAAHAALGMTGPSSTA